MPGKKTYTLHTEFAVSPSCGRARLQVTGSYTTQLPPQLAVIGANGRVVSFRRRCAVNPPGNICSAQTPRCLYNCGQLMVWPEKMTTCTSTRADAQCFCSVFKVTSQCEGPKIHTMCTRFIYIQHCLQQDLWINTDPQGNIGVQVHNTACNIPSSEQKKQKKQPFRAPWVMKGDCGEAVWITLRHKTQHQHRPLDNPQTPINHLPTQPSSWYSYNHPLQVEYKDYQDNPNHVTVIQPAS